MKKALISNYGDPSMITVVDVDIAPPSAEEVQVRVEFAGFSGADVNMRRGTYPFQKKPPLTPGYCLIGLVQSNGSESHRWQPADRVACLSIYGADAELVNLPERYLIPVPAGIDLAQATALVLDWSTAYGMLFDAARIEAGQKVFIHGLSGAVGVALLKLARWRGVEVFGTASARNHPALIALGATPFDYSDKQWIEAMRKGGGVDAVFDALGFESFDESYSILRRGGVLVAYGMNLPALTGTAPRPILPALVKLLAKNMALFSGKRTTFFGINRKSETFTSNLLALFDLLKSGVISVPIKSVYPLERIQDAHRDWGKGAGMGAIVIQAT